MGAGSHVTYTVNGRHIYFVVPNFLEGTADIESWHTECREFGSANMAMRMVEKFRELAAEYADEGPFDTKEEAVDSMEAFAAVWTKMLRASKEVPMVPH